MITARRVALVLIAVLAALALPASAFAANIGPNYGTGTSVDSPATGDIPWANSGNIGAADTTYATASALPAAGGTSFYLYAKDFKFAVPEGATIDGITVEINRLAQGGGVRDTLVQLTKDGSALLGSNLALTGTDWPTGAPAVQVYGSASSLWGATWSVAEINSQDFGVALQVSNGHRNKLWTASVDYIRVTVAYTPPPTPLTVTAMADDKVYDGATTAAAHLSSTEAAVGDEVTFDYASAAFDTASAGNAKTVSVTGITLGGADAGKYALANTTASATADITPKVLTVTGATAANKIYDGKTDATVNFTGASLVGVVGDDDVELDVSSAEGAFADEDVDTDIPVGVTGLALSGADAGNYTVTAPGLGADITAKTLTLIEVTALDKTYDGMTNANVNYTALSGVISGDDVTLDNSASAAHFAVATAGKDISVTLSGLALTGADAGNYTLTVPGTVADITPKALTVSGATVADRIYDGKTDATVNFTGASLVGLVGDDDVELDVSSAEGAFADEHVDTDIPVSVNGLALSGADAGNYSVTAPALRADITPRTLHVTALGVDKTYDGTTSASVNFGSDKLAGDVVTVQHADAVFGSAGVGTDKAIAVTGLSLTGTDAANYRLASTEVAATADVTPAPLTVAGKNIKKLFGNTLTFAGTEFAATGLKGGDAVTSVALRSAGSVKTAAFGTYPIAASDAVGTGLGNYTITYVGGKLTVWGYRIGAPAKPLRTIDARKFVRGTSIPVAFVVRRNDGKVITTVAPKIRVTSFGKTIYGPKTVKYSAARGKYFHSLKSSTTWGKRQCSIKISLPGATTRSLTIWIR